MIEVYIPVNFHFQDSILTISSNLYGLTIVPAKWRGNKVSMIQNSNKDGCFEDHVPAEDSGS